MKLSAGFTKLVPSLLLFVFYAASFIALTFALKKIDVSVAYAIWSGVGTALIVIIGIMYFREAVTALKLVAILLNYRRCRGSQSRRGKALSRGYCYRTRSGRAAASVMPTITCAYIPWREHGLRRGPAVLTAFPKSL